jgi:hypothetical protein
MSIYKNTIWGGLPTSVAILVPTKDTVYSHFSYSLSNLVKVTTQMGIETHLFFDASTILINQRESLIKQAIEVGAEWVLWLDSDMMFPPTTLLRLLGHNQNIVGCNYMKRAYPFKSVAYTDTSDWESWIPIQYSDELVDAEASGMGCVLMRTEIFQKLEKPYFEYTYQPKTEDWGGEDFTLFKKLNKLGYQLKIDMNLSNEIHHIGTFAYGRSVSTNGVKKKEWNSKVNKKKDLDKSE